MKLTGVDIAALKSPQPAALWRIELRTDVGVTGSALIRHDLRGAVERIVRESWLGEDLRSVTGLWQRLQCARGVAEGIAPDVAAAAALDFAAWDLKARVEGQPLWRTLGGSRPRVRMHARAPRDIRDDGEFERWCGEMTGEFGARVLQLPVGDDAARNLRRLQLAARTLGDTRGDVELAVDAGGQWSVDDAIRHIGMLESRIGLSWVEAPVALHDASGMKRISDTVNAAVCASAAGPGVQGVHALLHAEAAHVIRIDPARDGITTALQIADAAFAFEVPVVVAAMPGNVHAHLAAALPYCIGIDVDEPARTGDEYSTDVAIADGWGSVGDRVGHGLEFARVAA